MKVIKLPIKNIFFVKIAPDIHIVNYFKDIHTSNVYCVKIQLKCCEMLFWLQENLLMYHIIWERGLLITVECLFWITDEVKKRTRTRVEMAMFLPVVIWSSQRRDNECMIQS